MLERTLSVERSSERLAERRRTRRRLGAIAFGVLLCLLLGTLIWGLRQNSVRISRVEVYGAEASLATYATNAMRGNYLGIIPRNSSFFFPEEKIRADILADHPDIAAISIFRNGLTGISIKTNDRTPIARWCGLAPADGVEEYCYVFDSIGYIFATASSSTQAVNSFTLYTALVGETLEPFRATIADAEKLPRTFDLARQLNTLGSQVTRVVVRTDEVDDYLASGTRITYVLGHEQAAFTALISSRDNFNLADGSVDYIDLRFDGKVYLKNK